MAGGEQSGASREWGKAGRPAPPLPMLNALRPDEVEETLDREEVLAQAPDRQGPYFRVPPFMEEEA